eukprot:3445897-Pyramimonas_sp.AAC.1
MSWSSISIAPSAPVFTFLCGCLSLSELPFPPVCERRDEAAGWRRQAARGATLLALAPLPAAAPLSERAAAAVMSCP